MNRMPAFDTKKLFLIVFLSAFFIRCIWGSLSTGFASDTACFYGWANMAFSDGLPSFYSSDTFSDYPPGYIYILWVIGAIFSLFKITYLSAPCLLLLKLPAILCDMAAGFLIYRMAKKYLQEKHGLLLAALYLFNPAIFLNSTVWGQVDAVFTLAVILVCYFMTEQRTVSAYIAFGVGVLIKPQTLVFAPILIFGIIEEVLRRDVSWRRIFHNLFAGLCVIFCMILVSMPFGLEHVITQYTSTLGSYPYIAVNAFNLWGFFGLNWVSQDQRLMLFTYEQWGTVIIVLIVLFAAFFFFKARESAARYFTTAAVLIISMFLFSVRMHERYLFPALALLLFSYILRPARETAFCYGGFSMLHFYNTAYILFFYDPQNYDRKAPLFVIVSGLMVCCGILYYYSLYRYDVHKVFIDTRSGLDFYSFSIKKAAGQTAGAGNARDAGSRKKNRFIPDPSAASLPFTRTDILIVLVITLVYAAVALYDLGDMDAPQSEYLMQQGDTVVLQTTEEQPASALYFYLGSYNNRQFSMEIMTEENGGWITPSTNSTFSVGSVFCWSYIALPENALYIRITCQSDQASVMELALADADGAYFMPVNAPEYPALFDEGDLFPENISFRNGTYFDEIYHARTAYEYLHGLTTYETTHPPLGKIFISIGIAIFGMSPFGWRIMGTLFGIFMLPLIYLLGRSLCRDRQIAGFACLLLACDFMHFAQTRIATIDVFVTFFIMLMYLFMYIYCRMSFYDTPLKKTFLPLGACGIAMGLGIACKWTGIYAGAGLALLFFGTLYRRYREYQYAKESPGKASNGISHKKIIHTFVPNTRRTIHFCLVFFVAIPALIYLLSYIPFRSSETGLFARMWNNQKLMLGYHAGLEATHPYSSSWYEWPTMIRPIFYYSGIISDTLREGISSFGNPIIWWMGILAALYMAYLAFHNKDRIAAILCISYIAQYLPWVFVTRLTFIYHYFPSVPFVVLMLMYTAYRFKQTMDRKHFLFWLALYSVGAVALFALFYPVLSGQTVSISYVDSFLRWLDSWVLIYG